MVDVVSPPVGGMKITAIAPWFGGKRTLAPIIVKELGEHKSYWEPFCGGISVILQKPRVRQECLNDLHRDLTNLAMVLQSPLCGSLHERAAKTLYSEGLYNACRDAIAVKGFEFADSLKDIDAQHVDRAYEYLVLSWMGRNGAAGTARINYQFTLRYTNNGGDSATRWLQVTDSIPEWHRRLCGVVICCRDGITLLNKIDDAPGAAIYLDPPYFDEGSAYEHAFGSGGGIFGVDDHQRLAEAARRFKHTRIVISYYENPRINELYPGWTVRQVTMNKALAAQNKRGVCREVAHEVLIINGESYGAHHE